MNALERLKEEYRNASRTEITDSSAGYSAGLRFAIRVLEEENYGVSHLRRPTKPIFVFNTEEVT